jgi:hypothetical protein
MRTHEIFRKFNQAKWFVAIMATTLAFFGLLTFLFNVRVLPPGETMLVFIFLNLGLLVSVFSLFKSLDTERATREIVNHEVAEDQLQRAAAALTWKDELNVDDKIILRKLIEEVSKYGPEIQKMVLGGTKWNQGVILDLIDGLLRDTATELNQSTLVNNGILPEGTAAHLVDHSSMLTELRMRVT